MSQIDASDFASLSAALDQHSNEEITAAVQAQEGGPDQFLDQVFEALRLSMAVAIQHGLDAVLVVCVAAVLAAVFVRDTWPVARRGGAPRAG